MPHDVVGLSFIFILHQTTTTARLVPQRVYCLLSLFYIKPQPLLAQQYDSEIVFYLYSTSNHNFGAIVPCFFQLSFIFILHQTTTLSKLAKRWVSLSFIFILHQTTTLLILLWILILLSFIFILHQTTTYTCVDIVGLHCLLSLFYIKPQHETGEGETCYNCLLSLFYIKPQHIWRARLLFSIVFYLYSTSNHNIFVIFCLFSDTYNI